MLSLLADQRRIEFAGCLQALGGVLIGQREFDVMDSFKERARLAEFVPVARHFRQHIQSRHFCAIMHSNISSAQAETDDGDGLSGDDGL